MSKTPRLSRKQALVLNLLTGAKELYGLELVRASEGELKRGTVYVTLSRMQDAGLVESRLEDPPKGYRGPPRRKYKATGLGEAALASWLDGLTDSFSGLRLAGLLVAMPTEMYSASVSLVELGLIAVLLLIGFALWIMRKQNVMSEIGGNYGRSEWVPVRPRVIDNEFDGKYLFVHRDTVSKYMNFDCSNINQIYFDEIEGLPEQAFKEFRHSVAGRGVMRDYKGEVDAPATLPACAGSAAKGGIVNVAPGSRVLSLVRTVCSAKCVDNIVETTYADFCVDYFAAEADGDKWRMRFANLRLYRDLARAIGLFSVFQASGHVIKEIVGVFKA